MFYQMVDKKKCRPRCTYTTDTN